jgi:predicted DNA-binding transcriptional regulator YafY
MLFATRFTPFEVTALYLAARLLSRYSDEQNPHVVKALVKLADALQQHSPLVARHITQAAASVRERPTQTDYVEAFEVITQAWFLARKARITYQGASDEQATERLFSPYVLEPSGLGYSCYVIGYDDLRGAMRTLKLERIRTATLTEEPFNRPDDFDPYRLLASAWGIIWSQDSQEEVRLRFAPRVARRVKESLWHPSQSIEDLPDGSCLFTVHIGSLTEIRPWIRQWGADVEALAPPALRTELAAEARALAVLYDAP